MCIMEYYGGKLIWVTQKKLHIYVWACGVGWLVVEREERHFYLRHLVLFKFVLLYRYISFDTYIYGNENFSIKFSKIPEKFMYFS